MHSKNTNYRPDIDGLRAVAIILVLLFHLDLGVPGGFSGVDVFFVISGFLITAVIRTSVASNRFSLTDFYARRLLRLHPALMYAIHKPHLPNSGLTVYRGISGEQFHGSKAS
ncbi:acyltransferase family protein [Pseudomonas sp. R3-41]